MSQHLICTLDSLSNAIQRYVVSDVVATLANETVTKCSEDQNNDTTLILTTSFTWMVFFTCACGSSDEQLQTCFSLREHDAVLDLETLRAPCPSDLRSSCHSSRIVMLSASASAQAEALELWRVRRNFQATRPL